MSWLPSIQANSICSRSRARTDVRSSMIRRMSRWNSPVLKATRTFTTTRKQVAGEPKKRHWRILQGRRLLRVRAVADAGAAVLAAVVLLLVHPGSNHKDEKSDQCSILNAQFSPDEN